MEGNKKEVFLKWCKDNGAIFPRVQFPYFDPNGVEGIAANSPISQFQAFLFIPNTIIVSIPMIKAHKEIGFIFANHEHMFNEDEDADYMVLSVFLLYEYLKGE